MIEIRQTGPLASIQDSGRRGLRHLGIPWAGALVPQWMVIANSLVGNRGDHPIIECFEGGFDADVRDQAVRIAVAGDATITVSAAGEMRTLASWQSHVLSAGSRFAIRSTGRWRLAVLAVESMAIEAWQGSCSTFTRAGLGGLDGGPLKAGDRLPITPVNRITTTGDRLERRCAPFEPSDESSLRLRCVPGPQQDAFTPAALDAFFQTPYRLTSECDRMGARLAGNAIAHKSRSASEIVSDAIVPGSIQVPGNGQPIVLLADAHTAGGYPKIATVIGADLAWLALQRPGSTVHFDRVDVPEAIELAREAAADLSTRLDASDTINVARMDDAALQSCNLIDGVTDGN